MSAPIAVRPPLAIQMGHQHGEAFCLMLYRAKSGAEEWIYNSRDGVTPFVAYSRDQKEEIQHVEFYRDRFEPNHTPKIGDRVFVHLTNERARSIAERRVEHFWNHAQYPMRDRFSSEEYAIDAVAKEIFGDGKGPDLVEVTAEWLGRYVDARLRLTTYAERFGSGRFA